MRPLLFASLLIAVAFSLVAVSSGLKAVPYGQVWSAETLFPSSTPTLLTATKLDEAPKHDETTQNPISHDTIEDNDGKTSPPNAAYGITSEQPFNMDDHFHNKDGDDWGAYVPIDWNNQISVVRRAVGLERRGVNRGILQMDYLKALEVCKNAGWYQNCLNEAKGDYKKVEYENGPTKAQNSAADIKNRWQSGVLTTWTPPCRAWPFCQRTWHPFANLRKQKLHKKGLETDEWPMASMKNPDFDATASTPQISLRCMTHDQNTAGSNQVMAFGRCWPDYRAGGK